MRRPPRLLWAAGVGAGAVGLILLAGLLLARWPFGFDRWLLLALRSADPRVPAGPRWLAQAMPDVTALGGGTVLTIVSVAAVILLLVAGHRLTALVTAAAILSGSEVVDLFKGHFARARPTVVPHLVEVNNYSFPSGHSANSAIVYLTLAALVTQVVPGRALRNAIVALAVVLVGAIGFSRVFLGVHWPSDVLGGWSFGTLWALAWWWAGAKARASLRR